MITKFVCPISLEETPAEDGILLDNKMYSLSCMRKWIWRKNTVPHSRRTLTDAERDLINEGDYVNEDEYAGEDTDEDTDFTIDDEGEYVVNGSLPDELGGFHEMVWDEFEYFLINIKDYFDNTEIDAIVDAVVSMCGLQFIVNVQRKYIVTNVSTDDDEDAEIPEVDVREIFDVNIRVQGYEFYQKGMPSQEYISQELVDELHDYVIRWYSGVFWLILSGYHHLHGRIMTTN